MPPDYHDRVRDPVSLGMRLPVKIIAYRVAQDTMYIEYFEVAERYRGRGIGTKAYEKWERALPREIKTIRLHAADTGDGPSTEFWEALGFDYRWTEDEIDEAVEDGSSRHELEQEMVKDRT